ncbi:hypothetical protein C4D60_Mb06t16490 [Musa balbisiana]|uniref:Uncharacterized protein n=1 Tax=Musa balbisiana TaxID=52838 RepID=A0A4S8INH0_MUSBA|nr:hypothetical protein C4D60_Mb06t16490 [Musa balbisiana]
MVDETGLLERSLMYDARFGPLKFKFDTCHLLGLKMIGSDSELLRYITGKVRLGAGKNITFCILRAHS